MKTLWHWFCSLFRRRKSYLALNRTRTATDALYAKYEDKLEVGTIARQTNPTRRT